MLTSARLEENERNQRIAELERQLDILRQVSAKAAELVAAKPVETGPARPQPRLTLRG
jgi:hypothetical protein